MPESSADPEGQNRTGPDIFGFFKHEILGLLDQGVDAIFSPLSSKAKESVNICPKAEENGKQTDPSQAASSLFSNSMQDGVPDFKRELLRSSLRQSVTALTKEVDEMVDPVVRIRHLISFLSSKKQHSAVDDQLEKGLSLPALKKQKLSPSKAKRGVHADGNEDRDNEAGDVSEGLKFLLESDDNLLVEETLTRHSVELDSVLNHMQEQLEELLDAVVSKCRPMIQQEKQELCRLIQELPSKNLDRVVEIIQAHRGISSDTSSDKVFVELEEQLGMASALETICGQSYGAGQYYMVGIHTQRAMVVLLLLSIPIAIVWANTERILLALGQDASIAAEAGPYAQCMIPSLFAYGLLQCLFRFFQTQSSVFPMVLSSGITTLVHIFVCWTLVFKAGLGGRGAALANTISYWINLLILALYVKFAPSCSKTWTGFSIASLHGIPGFLRLGIPSALMVCLEMWSFEMIVLLSGLLPNPQLETSVLSISLNTTSVVWVIPEGLSGAISTRVANELGAGKPKTARLAIRVVVCTTIFETLLVGLVLILVRDIWGYAYSSDMEVVRYLAAMMPLLAAVNCLDGIACVLSGAARGCGWQKIGAYINLASFYIVGLPIAVLLAFFMHLGGRGLFMGFMCALTIQSLCLLAVTLRTNWDQEAKKATDRVNESKIPRDIVF